MGKAMWQSLAGTLCTVTCALAQTTVLFETQFERSEGYDPAKDLAGQRNWLMEGTGGNGLLDGTFTGLGQQAYIGFLAPTDTNAFTSVWRPIDFDPAPANNPLVHFSVKFQIVTSTKGSQDDFRWSVYNKAADRLFSIDFETSTGTVSFVPQDGKFVATGSSISFDGIYDLDVWMDFKRNSYSAYLNDYLLINSETLTQKNSPLTFGDVDAVWFVRAADPKQAGDNYMAFDNYRITAEAISSIPSYVETPSVKTNGFFNFRAFGEKGLKYSVEVTQDFVTWHALGEYTITSAGAFDFEDDTSKGFKRGFYRLRQVP
jgi:hypothetical protein